MPLVPCTGIFLGPSKSGKTVALISMILEQYRGVFEKIYIFSPSIGIDDGWIPVKKHVEDLAVIEELSALLPQAAQDLRAGDPRTLQLPLRLLSEAKE